MKQSSATGRRLAIATGGVASCGALYFLLKDDVMAGRWSDAYVLMPIMVFIAVAAGHLFSAAIRSRKLLSAAGFAVAFTLSSLLTIYTSVGKQAGSSDAAALAAVASNELRQAKEADLARARIRYTDAQTMADRERSDRRCGGKCQDWERRSREVAAYISAAEAELAKMAPPKPVSATATRAAQLVSTLTGVDQSHARELIVMFEPVAYSIALEITSIFALGYGFGRRPAPPTSAGFDSPAREPPPRQRNRAPRKRNTEPDEVVDWVREFRARKGRDPQIPELQRQFPGTPKTTAWRRAKQT